MPRVAYWCAAHEQLGRQRLAAFASDKPPILVSTHAEFLLRLVRRLAARCWQLDALPRCLMIVALQRSNCSFVSLLLCPPRHSTVYIYVYLTYIGWVRLC